MKQRGFTLIGLLIVIAILGIIAAIIALNVTGFFGSAGNKTTTNETLVTNTTIFHKLAAEPITSLNLTELNFMVDYTKSKTWWDLTIIYQNQIIILKLAETK